MITREEQRRIHMTPLARLERKVRLPRWERQACVRLRTGYTVEIRTIIKDIHPANVDGSVLILALDSDTGRKRGMIGIPGADWPEVRDALEAAYRKTLNGHPTE